MIAKVGYGPETPYHIAVEKGDLGASVALSRTGSKQSSVKKCSNQFAGSPIIRRRVRS
jgi:hypothetical protein